MIGQPLHPARPARMVRARRWALSGLVLAAGLLLGTPAVPAPSKQPTPAQKEAELRRVNSRIEKVQKAVNEDIEKRDKLSAQLRDAELGVQKARKTLDQIHAERLATEARLQDLEQEERGLEQDLAAERGALAGELRAAYVNGREEELKLLLNQEDPATFGRMLSYYGYFGRARAERIAGIRDKLEHLALVREKIAAEHERLAALEADQQQQVAALRSAQESRTRAVAAIEGQIRNQRSELGRLQSQAQALERLIDQLRKALEETPVAKQAPFEPLRGKLPWPVQQGRVLARFGQPRAGGSMRWQGMLIGTDRGARVRAPYAGRVVYADWLPGMGLMVVLDHGGGYMSLYGHNEELFRKVGDAVSAGDVIGSVGDTGGHNEPALYFEVRRGRQPVDPETWLQKR
ncbi:MAG TPA: peptidoglycan DD-metalloendopeptidase family protein [Steroidobacteraceae bacterium]|nr:peptidoglycan DD-metalloendopeptidase family protein [Steroidobacteraceae bacterium]HQR48103.1 peptidoglycan DD-metalloendopeptidase family protein [Steroidobacteraceae bacterium]